MFRLSQLQYARLTLRILVVSDLVPLRKRGVIQGIANIAIGAGSGLGGLLGGWIDGVWGWRTAFLIQVPFVILGTAMVLVTVKVPVQKTRRSALSRVDYLGSITLTSALVLFLLGVNTGGNVLPWSHPIVFTVLPLSVVFFALFIYVEERVALEPILPVRLLLDRTIASGCLGYWFTFMAFYGVMYYLPVYLQLLGNSPTEAGQRFIPSSVGTAAGALGAGIIMRTSGNYYYLNKVAHLLLLMGSVLTATLHWDTPSWCPFLYLGISGLGFGGMLVTTLISLVSSVEQDQQAVVTSAGFAFRSTGSVIGLAICSAAFQNLLRLNLRRKIGGVKDADKIIARIRKRFDEVNLLDPTMRSSVQDCYTEALRGVFIITCGFTILAALTSLFMRQNKLHSSLARR